MRIWVVAIVRDVVPPVALLTARVAKLTARAIARAIASLVVITKQSKPTPIPEAYAH
jgi:hypothetical protein